MPHDIIHDFGRGPEHIDTGVAGIVALAADPYFADGKVPPIRENFIQHLRQNQRINDVPTQLDLFGKHTDRILSVQPGFKLIPKAAGARIVALHTPLAASNDTALTTAELSQA